MEVISDIKKQKKTINMSLFIAK